jgi:5-methylcytosine-specific restriction enzyme subunit McrC
VAACLRQRLEQTPSLSVHAQDSSHCFASVGDSGRPVFRLQPDIVIRTQGVTTCIADTKWKRLTLSPSGYLYPDQTDVYQLYAYAAAYQCENVALIYPWHGGLSGAKETVFVLTPIGHLRPILHVVCVDLESDPFTLMQHRQNLW